HAVEKIAEADSRRKGPRQRAELKVLREVGKHPDDVEPINVIEGRYGPYLKHNGTNAPLPRGIELDDVTLEQAINAIAARAGSGKGTGRKVAKKAAAPKAARKKAEATDEQPKAKAKPTAKAKKKAAPKKKAAAKKAAEA